MTKLSEKLLIQALYYLEMNQQWDAHELVQAVWLSECKGIQVPAKVLEKIASMTADAAIQDAKWQSRQ